MNGGDVLSGAELPRIFGAVPGPRSIALCETLARHECPAHTARRARRAETAGTPADPIVWTAARGANVQDADGNVFVDLTAGFGAALVGHGHSAVIAAVTAQAARLMHALGDAHPSDTKIALEQRLASMAPWPDARVILGLSGSDAVEAAMKSAVLATGRAGVIAFEGGYHGLAHGPLAACGYKAAFRAPFREQLGSHVSFAPYPTVNHADRALAAVRSRIARGDVGAVLIEPVLGRGGVHEADAACVEEIARIAHQAGALLVADEIYTGLRRASREWLYSAAHWKTPADIVCVGKALGGTLPLSACLLRDEIARAWGNPDGEAIHTSTFLGNPLACAAGLATIGILDEASMRATLDECAAHLWAEALQPIAHDPRCAVVELGGARLLAG